MSHPGNTSSPSGLGEQRSGGETQMDCDAIHDLATGYVLDALEPDEIELVEAHIRDCASCAAHTAELERTVSVLPYLSRRVAPPPDVKTALFSRIAQAQAQPASPSEQRSASAPLRPSTVHAIPDATPTIPAARTAARKRRGLLGLSSGRSRWAVPGRGRPPASAADCLAFPPVGPDGPFQAPGAPTPYRWRRRPFRSCSP